MREALTEGPLLRLRPKYITVSTVDAGLLKLHVRGAPGTRLEDSEKRIGQIEQTIRKEIGEGPAPEAGSRRVSKTPRGVTTRTASTNSSMCVWSVAKCPPERVAIQPPSVDHSNDCGKCLRVRSCGFSCASSSGPKVPAAIRAARDAPSTSSTPVRRRRSMLTVPR